MSKRLDSCLLAALMIFSALGFIALMPERASAADGIDYIMIVDAPNGGGSWISSRNYTFGENETFYAAAYNNTSGWVQDVSVYWSYPSSGLAKGNQVVRMNATSGSEVRIDTNGYGIAHLRAYYHGGVSNLTNYTGPLRVSVANVDSVIVRSERGGAGTWVGPTTYQSGDNDKFYAAAYDSSGGFLGDIVSNWTSTNLSVGYLYSSPGGRTGGCDSDGTQGTCYPRINFHASSIGYTYVNATPVGASISNMTGKLTVTGVGIDYIQIRDAPNGHGQVMGNRTYYEREQDTFYAASYNFTLGYRGEVVGDWTTNDSAVCKVKGYSGNNAHGSSVQLLLLAPGTCKATVNATTISGVVSNTTDTLTVLQRTTITVDANGGKDYTKIQDAVDNSSDGYTVVVYPATYYEHVVVNKQIEIVGTDRAGVILDGSDTGTALYLGANRIVIHNFTIQNADYGVFNNQTNNTRLYHMTVKDYEVGLNNSITLNAWVAYNLIKQGKIGVVAYKAYDDAIRYNEIAYNTQYGGKGYDAHLRNCFNWNNLHNNGIGYYYDPTTDLPPMEFDGNVMTFNDVGVKVENSSAITVTSNEISHGGEGVQLLASSSEVKWNTITTVEIGVRFQASNSLISGNTIAATGVGIIGDGVAPRIEGNDITVSSGLAMDLSNLDGAIIQGNDVHGGTIVISNSRVGILNVVNSKVILIDTTVESLKLDSSSQVDTRYTVRVKAVDSNGGGLSGASVSARDARGQLSFSGETGADGFTVPFGITVGIQTSTSYISFNPFSFDVSSASLRGIVKVSVDAPRDIVVTVSPGTPIWLVVVVALAMFASALLAGALSIERSKYALFAFFLPLYSRIDRDKTLDNYNRGRVYQYIELNPGTHFNAIIAALSMNNGALVYHINVLSKAGLVTSRQDGIYRRFYPHGMTPPPLLENGTTESQLRVLKAIQEMPGITQKELAKFLGLRQSTLAYQIDRLTAMNYIIAEKRGRKVHYMAKKGGN